MKFVRIVALLLGVLSGSALAQEASLAPAVADSLPASGDSTLAVVPAGRETDSLLSDSIAEKRDRLRNMQGMGAVVTSVGVVMSLLGVVSGATHDVGCEVEHGGVTNPASAEVASCKDNNSSGFIVAMGGAVALGGLAVLVMSGQESRELGEMEKRRSPRGSVSP